MIKKINDFKLFKAVSGAKRVPLFIGLEITSRCNLNCEHCYINLSASNKEAKLKEITFNEIDRITDEALKLGTLWFSLTGGEPLLREDFIDIYLLLKKKGFLVSVLTNATLITEEHIEIFKKYPPRCLEISVYGMTKETCESVTRTKNSLACFHKGFMLCVINGFDVILKTVATRAILPELGRIKSFAASYENVVFKIEDILISRIDENHDKTKQIRKQRSLPLGKTSRPRTCETSGLPGNRINSFGGNLFLCHAGVNSCWISSDGMAHLCTTLRYPAFAYDLRKGDLNDYWTRKVPMLLGSRSENPAFKADCGSCSDRPDCDWCPALSWVETRRLDSRVEYVCAKMHNER